MSKLKHIEIPESVYFVTTNTVNNEPYFEIDRWSEIVRDCLLFQRVKERIYLYAYVIMPSHLHVIFQLRNSWPLGKVMQSIKGNSAYKITHFDLNDFGVWIGQPRQPRSKVGILADQSSVGVYPRLRTVWQKNYYDHVIRNEKDFDEKWQYIYNNPVDADLVDKPQEYKWSSFYKYAPETDKI